MTPAESTADSIRSLSRAELELLVERYRFAAQGAQLGVWDWDIRSNSLFWDDTLYRLYGAEALVGEPLNFALWERMVHPLDLPDANMRVQQALKGLADFRTTFRVRLGGLPSGEIRYIGGIGTVVRDEHGTPTRMLGLNWDRTPEAKLEQNLLQYKVLIDAASKFYCLTDSQGHVQMINRYAREQWGCEAEGTFFDFFDSDSQLIVRSGLDAIIRSHEPWSSEVSLIHGKSGEVAPFAFRAFLVPGPDGATQQVGWIGNDLREQKKSQAQLLESARLAALGTMAGGIAHEINNPLAVMQGKVFVLKRGIDAGTLSPAQITQGLDDLGRLQTRIATIVKGLRSFSRSADNEETAIVALAEVLDETLGLCQSRFRYHGVEILVDLTPGTQIHAHRIQFEQVLLNLFNNAFDAIESFDKKWIRIRERTDLGDPAIVTIDVSDCGHGIPPEIVSRIMEPFFTTKEVGRGTGLGLSISQGIMESMGGALRYAPAEQNTTFRIEIPRAETPRL